MQKEITNIWQILKLLLCTAYLKWIELSSINNQRGYWFAIWYFPLMNQKQFSGKVSKIQLSKAQSTAGFNTNYLKHLLLK